MLLQAENLHHSFTEGETENKVLQGVCLKVMRGETTAVVGPSGCGKSTLLYLLGLLDRPKKGEIYFHGTEVAKSDDKVRTNLRNNSIGFIFQFHFLLKELTALENVSLPMRKSGLTRMDSHEKSLDILKKLGLESKSDRYANKLSGGEQQRVAIARAIANSPSLILADEPTGNLDSRNSENVFSLLQNIARDQDIGVLVVTHNPELAKNCDQIIEIQDGKNR